MLTIILCSLAGLVVLLALIGLLMPSRVMVERSITIDQPVEKIFPWAAELKQWPHWTVWSADRDPTLVYNYPGPTTGLGGSMHWTSRKMGNGSLTFTEFTPNQALRYELQMPGHKPLQGHLEFESAGGGATRVSWYDDIDMGGNPFKKLMGPLLKRMLGHAFGRNLVGLKIAAVTGKASGPGPN